MWVTESGGKTWCWCAYCGKDIPAEEADEHQMCKDCQRWWDENPPPIPPEPEEPLW